MFNKLLNISRLIIAFILNLVLPGIGYFLYKKIKVGIILFIVYIVMLVNLESVFVFLFMFLVALSTFYLEKQRKEIHAHSKQAIGKNREVEVEKIELKNNKQTNNSDFKENETSMPVKIKTLEDSFVNNSKKFKDISGQEAEMPYFQTYWPTFSKMDKDQLNFYFYFRDQVNKGNYIDACLSYQFVYVYELISCIYISDWRESIQRLKDFYEYYRQDYPKLDNYLPRWIGDMYLKYNESEEAFEWFEQINSNIFDNYAISRYNFELRIEEMSLDCWGKLFNARDNKFNSKQENQQKINENFLKLLNYMNERIEKDMKHTLLDYLNKKTKTTHKYQLFRSAVYEGEQKYIFEPYKEFVGHRKTSKVLSQIKRYVENKLREEAGERKIKYEEDQVPGRLREYMDDFRFKTIIQEREVKGSQIPGSSEIEKKGKQRERKVIELDSQKINKIEAEQKEVVNELSQVLSPEQGLGDKDGLQIQEDSNNAIESLDDIFGSDSEIEEKVEFDQVEEKILKMFIDGNNLKVEKEQLREVLRDKGLFMNQVVNQINEKAYDLLSDTLIEDEDNIWYCEKSKYDQIKEQLRL